MSHDAKSESWPNIGAAICKARKDKGMGQKNLAEKIGLTASGLSRIETRGRLNIGTLRRIARALDTEMWRIVAYASGLDDLDKEQQHEPHEAEPHAPR